MYDSQVALPDERNAIKNRAEEHVLRQYAGGHEVDVWDSAGGDGADAGEDLAEAAWFFERERYGGALCDIGCHQIEQFLTFTGSSDAEIKSAAVGNFANPADPGLEDFGEMLLEGDRGRGYVRVNWYTPDGLANWGDGRLTILGTGGYIELRKFVDIAGRPGTNHLFLVDNKETRYIDCSDAGLPYYPDLIADILGRTERAMTQAHCFKVMELALRAEAMARRLGNLQVPARAL